MNEADTCRMLVRPKLEAAGWDSPPYSSSEKTSEHGNVMEIAEKFGGAEKLVEAVHRLQTLLYAA